MNSTPSTFGELVSFLIGFVNTLVLLIFALAFVITMWKIIDAWVIHADNETKRAEGKMIAVTSSLVMVVMLSIWGIMSLLQRSIF